MNKRLEKRHKRQVARARNSVKESSPPDLRTHEQVSAAREASRSVSGPRDALREPYAVTAPARNAANVVEAGAAKEDSQ